ncbi:MAG TPA: acyltransferase domain-containing protein, partial [Myxococcota bacterium]
AFVFPGQGSQYAGMGSRLYADIPEFRAAFDEVTSSLGSAGAELAQRMFAGGAEALKETVVTQPATFALEYALARLWLARGVRPSLLIGHSVGEFVAAVIAGVMPLASAARLVAERGRMMQAMPAGAMLSVRLPADKLEPVLPKELSLAADNGPSACVVAGESGDVEKFRAQLDRDGVVARLLQTSHAFHSAMMDPVLAPFLAEVRKVKLAAPRMKIVSTLTGTWLSDDEATSPEYWAKHLRATVRFSPAVKTALAAEAPAFLELGPRATLSTLARQHKQTPAAVPSMADTPEQETTALTLAAGQLWMLGVDVAWFDAGEKRRRIVLPTTPFQRKRFWVDAIPGGPLARAHQLAGSAAPSPQPSAASSSSSSSSSFAPSAPLESPVDRRPSLLARLKTLFEDVAGVDLADADVTMAFVELGLDSLTLTQAATQVKKSFAVSVTFRDLMARHRSFDALASYLDEQMPKEAAPTPDQGTLAMPPPMVPMTSMMQPIVMQPAAAGAPLVQQVIQQQMMLMQQQLALLSGAAPMMQPVASAAPTISAAQAPSVASTATAASTTSTDDPLHPNAHKTYDVKKAFGAIARIHTVHAEMTERQKARLEAFTRRYVDKTKKSKAYTSAHRPHLAD